MFSLGDLVFNVEMYRDVMEGFWVEFEDVGLNVGCDIFFFVILGNLFDMLIRFFIFVKLVIKVVVEIVVRGSSFVFSMVVMGIVSCWRLVVLFFWGCVFL